MSRADAQYEAYVSRQQRHTATWLRRADRALRERVATAQQRVGLVMARQGHIIENVAIKQLNARRERLVAQQTEARYEVADSYDRVAQTQSAGEKRSDACPASGAVICAGLVIAGCANNPDKRTLADLHAVPPDVQEVQVDQGLDMAMQGYRRFSRNTRNHRRRRRCDASRTCRSKTFGLRAGDGKPREMARPAAGTTTAQAGQDRPRCSPRRD
jgi:hypothetical protein